MKEDIKPFESMLKSLLSRSASDYFSSDLSDKETALVFNTSYKGQLAKDKSAELIESLVTQLSKDTLGSLISKALKKSRVDEKEILAETGLTPSLLEDIKNDSIFTNSVPVKSLAKLLRKLGLNLDSSLT